MDDIIFAYEGYLTLPQEIRNELPFFGNSKEAWMEPLIQLQISMKKSLESWYTSQNKKKVQHEVSTSETSKDLYDEFSTVSDQHTADPKENRIENDVEHMTLHENFKIEGDHVMKEDKPATLEQLLEDIQVDGKVDHSFNGSATSDLASHVEEDTIQWYAVIANLFEDNNIMSHLSHEIGAFDHEKVNNMTSPVDRHEDIKHKRTDFVYFGMEEVRRSKKMNEEWMRKVKEAKLVAANARKHLQEVKAKVNLLNIARQKRIDDIRRLLESENTYCSNEDDKMCLVPSKRKQEQVETSSYETKVVHSLETQLKVKEDEIIAALSHHDRMHKRIEEHLWAAQLERRQKGIGVESSLDDLQVVKEGMDTMKSNYLNLLSDCDHLLNLVKELTSSRTCTLDVSNDDVAALSCATSSDTASTAWECTCGRFNWDPGG